MCLLLSQRRGVVVRLSHLLDRKQMNADFTQTANH